MNRPHAHTHQSASQRYRSNLQSKIYNLKLFQLGPRKDHRPDLLPLNVMPATLDPLGMPVATQVVAGNKADDRLHIPAIEHARASMERHELLSIGDCTMMSLHNLHVGGDYYPGLLSLNQAPKVALEHDAKPVWSGAQHVERIKRQNAAGKMENIAEGYETQANVTALLNDEEVALWQAHRISALVCTLHD